MNWFEIILSSISNLVIGCIVLFSYQLSYDFAKKHYGWTGYKRIFWVIGLIGIFFGLSEYEHLGPLDSGLTDSRKEFIVKAILTISVPALIGVLMANKTKRDFYREVRKEQIDLYQDYLNKILKVVDVDNNTNWARGGACDKDKLEKDDALMEEINHEAGSKGLKPAYLQIMANQYFFADPWEREKDKSYWVSRALNRKSVDYFPDPWALYKTLNEKDK